MGSPDVPRRVLRVVVVEDDPDDAELLLRELRRGNYDPHAEIVDDLATLREVLSRGGWDIVISDWSLPTFDGLAAFRLMKELGLDLPFIIVSGTIGEENAVEALKAGVHDFMSKGRFARLLPAIERELREAVVRQEKRAAEALLARQREETENSEQLLRSVLQTVPDGVVVVEPSAILKESPVGRRILYVVLTRATQRLVTVGTDEAWRGRGDAGAPSKERAAGEDRDRDRSAP